MLPTGDSHVIKEISLNFCRISFLVYTSVLIFLYFSEYYLLAGRREYLRFYLIFLFTEILKWIYHKTTLERDLRLTYKKKPLAWLTLFLKCFDIVHLCKSLVLTVLGSFAFHFLAVLFGAEMFSKFEETYVFALSLSILTVLPLTLNFGTAAIPHILSGVKAVNSLHGSLGRAGEWTLLGAWAGAVVIPLDWDRPWQVWPIPNSLAALLFHALSHLLIYLHIQLLNSNYSIFKKFKF